MNETATRIRVLLIDDEEGFRRATRAPLERRGFTVVEAGNGPDGLAAIRDQRPDVVLLDLKMPGMSGIEALHGIREIAPELPVIVLTGHGGFADAYAGIRLKIVDFLQKPVDIDRLATRIHAILDPGRVVRPLRERTIAELMVSPDLYPHLYSDQSAAEAFERLTELFFEERNQRVETHGIRSALVFDRRERFCGMLRFSNLLRLVLPDYLEGSPYTSYFTGMFLAQCKVIGDRRFAEIMDPLISVDLYSPLLEAAHLMVAHHQISLPVIDRDVLVGVLRDRAVVLEITRNLGRAW